MKIALISTTNLNVITGRDNNVRTRVKYLNSFKDVDLDVFFIRHDEDFILRLLMGRKKQIMRDCEIIDGIKYKNLWLQYTFVDAVLTYVLKIRSIICKKQLESLISIFSNYDLILAHTLEGKYIAYKVKEEFGIPYINGWHGSDINIIPFRSKKIFMLHKRIIENSSYNLFVSKALLNKSNEIVDSNNKGVSYSGISSHFICLDKQEKQNKRKEYKLNNKYVIGFVGRLLPIKNVLVLPSIFKIVQEEIKDVCFVVVGDGKLESALKNSMQKKGVNKCLFLGKVNPDNMPEIMNCIDVLVLPSLNEGLPLVAIEAMACGAFVVGSNVGGTSEAIGIHNVFALNSKFIDNISNRIIEILKNREPIPELSPIFSWEKTIANLICKCKDIVSKEKVLH